MRASRQGRGTTPPSQPTPTIAPGKTHSRRKFVRVGAALVILTAGYFLGRYTWAQYHLAAVDRALATREYGAADARLNQALWAWEDESSRLLAARLSRRAGRFEEAIERLRAYRQDYPEGPAFDREVRFLRMEQGDLGTVNGGLDASLRRDTAADPVELEAALAGGAKASLAAFTSGETAVGGRAMPLVAKVLQAAELWLRLRPAAADQAQGLVWRGIARNCLNDRPGSLADLRAALELDPTLAEARLHLALVLILTEPEVAAEHLRVLLRQEHPDDIMVRMTLAWLARNTGRPDEARRLLDDVLAAQPRNAAALLERGSLAHDEGQLDDAERWLSRAYEASPDNPKVSFALAALLRAKGRGAEAQVYTDRFQRLDDERKRRSAPTAGPPK